jgi:hypothetical protein
MEATCREVVRVLKPGAWAAFEVGKVRNGKVDLAVAMATAAERVGLRCELLLVHRAHGYSKVAQVFGVDNETLGVNANQIVVCRSA